MGPLRKPVLFARGGLNITVAVFLKWALLIAEQAFQEQIDIPRNTILIEQRTYPLLDLTKRRSTLDASTIFESWLPLDSETCIKDNCSAKRTSAQFGPPQGAFYLPHINRQEWSRVSSLGAAL
jgi:hypothetical protein